METLVKVVLYESNLNYNTLDKLKTYLNASDLMNNGKVVVSCNLKEYLSIARWKIHILTGVKYSKIYTKFKHL